LQKFTLHLFKFVLIGNLRGEGFEMEIEIEIEMKIEMKEGRKEGEG
jgi:hypothetical protein